ncbi:HAD family hydrolase [Tetragenococcus halophilus]|uniref:HAD family hydrolase n=1 Tax=Tetragenococcus halophilus TaxID=51669 RepID=A0AB37D1M2_TETHA|nr:HAD family hydrolase [Tetragenococcus halophilus]QGP75993.1 HAD family hydrolase [Tetragenococcus halophilus]GMG68021.1 haloacid dehalogenase [Tetragenococcus halophilus]
MDPFEMAKEFHATFNPEQPDEPTAFTKSKALHRASFKVEEIVELLYAASPNNKEDFFELVDGLHEAIEQAKEKVLSKQSAEIDPLVAQTDALADIMYFTYGSFVLLGVDPQPIMDIVHQANMGKVFPDGKPHYDKKTNKVLKPANWEAYIAPEGKITKELQRQKEEK